MNRQATTTGKLILFVTLLALALALPGLPAQALDQQLASSQTLSAPSRLGPTNPQELAAFLDDYFAKAMAELYVPGLAFVLVKDGKIFFAQGYGYADVERQIPYDPDASVFWAASISKAFTTVGVLQLYERGLIDLHDDVNRYLEDFQIPATFAQPVTFAHLLTHTDGFAMNMVGGAARTAADLKPLRLVVQQTLPKRNVAPGRFLTYGNYGADLAGLLIEEIAGMSFSQYMAENIFQPLGMKHTTFEQVLPSDLASQRVIGYSYRNGALTPQPYYYIDALPRGGVRTSAGDMARFMFALLQGGGTKDARILNDATTQLMFEQQFSSHPRLGGITYGLMEVFSHNQRLLVRDGDGIGFMSRLVLLPAHNLGFFINYNSDDADRLREDLIDQFLARYYPVAPSAPPSPPADFQAQASQYSGYYRPIQADEATFFKLALIFALYVHVTANDDGTLTITPASMGDAFGGFETVSRWAAFEPLFFQPMDGNGAVAFGRDEQGNIAYLFSGQGYHGAYRKLPWWEASTLHLGFLVGAQLFFLTTPLIWLFGAWRNRRQGVTPSAGWPRLAHGVAGLVCVLYVLFLIGIFVVCTNVIELIDKSNKPRT